MSEEDNKQKASRKASVRNASLAASASNNEKASKAKSTSDFCKFTTAALEFQIFTLQAQLELIRSLSECSDDEKAELIFDILDEDGDGKIDARELASGLKRIRADLTFQESLETAVDRIAAFDTNDDDRLDPKEFKTFLETMAELMGTSFHEVSELIVLQILFSPTGNTFEEEVVGHIAQETGAMDEAVEETKTLNAAMLDKRMLALFALFDLNDDDQVEFKEIAIGLNKMTMDMDASAKSAFAALLMFDRDDKRTLDYEEFSMLILNLVASGGEDVAFDDVADAMTIAACMPAIMSEEDLVELIVADELYKGLKELQEEEEDIADAVDILQYGRMKRLFALWDLNSDGKIDGAELLIGLRKFSVAKDLESTMETAMATVVTFDADADAKLDETEFAVALVKIAKEVEIDLHDLVDFLVVVSALKDADTAEEKFIQSHSKSITQGILDVQDELEKLVLEEAGGDEV